MKLLKGLGVIVVAMVVIGAVFLGVMGILQAAFRAVGHEDLLFGGLAVLLLGSLAVLRVLRLAGRD